MIDFLKTIFSKEGKKPLINKYNHNTSLTEKQLENLIDAKKLTFGSIELKEKFEKCYTENRFKNLISSDVQKPTITTNNPKK